MSTSKESTVTLPRVLRRPDSKAYPSTNKQLSSLPESSQLSSKKQYVCSLSNQDFVTKHNTKKLTSWFKSWRTWQRRIFTCRVMDHCSKQHLELLATSLEPVLHFDFSSSFSAPLQSLHLDNMATFQVQRTILQSMVNPRIMDVSDSLSHPPTTLSSSDSNTSLKQRDVELKPSSQNVHCSLDKDPSITASLAVSSSKDIKDSNNKARETILPALPLIHIQHAPALSSGHQSSTSIEDLVTLQRKHFSSVPDFKSTADLLRDIRQRDVLKNRPKRRHHRARTVGTYHVFVKTSREERRQTELFKQQLAIASNLRRTYYVVYCFPLYWVHITPHWREQVHLTKYPCYT